MCVGRRAYREKIGRIHGRGEVRIEQDPSTARTRLVQAFGALPWPSRREFMPRPVRRRIVHRLPVCYEEGAGWPIMSCSFAICVVSRREIFAMSGARRSALEVFEGRPRQVESVRAKDFDFEMVNLTEDDTGVAGTIYISSKFPRHAPRVKWYQGRPKNPDNGYIALSIDADPSILENRIGQIYATRTLADARAWVARNADALMIFWERGALFDRREMNAFLDGLKKL